MPWCETCAKFWNPNSVAASGRCPSCGIDLGSRRHAAGPEGAAAGEDPADPTARRVDRHSLSEVPSEMGPDWIDTTIPWHFWVMVAALVVYLGWRLVQGIAWLLGNTSTGMVPT